MIPSVSVQCPGAATMGSAHAIRTAHSYAHTTAALPFTEKHGNGQVLPALALAAVFTFGDEHAMRAEACWLPQAFRTSLSPQLFVFPHHNQLKAPGLVGTLWGMVAQLQHAFWALFGFCWCVPILYWSGPIFQDLVISMCAGLRSPAPCSSVFVAVYVMSLLL